MKGSSGKPRAGAVRKKGKGQKVGTGGHSRKALEGNDTDAIKQATESLMTSSQAFSQKLYEAAARDANAEGSSATGQGAGSVEDDDIVDAEIVDEG